MPLHCSPQSHCSQQEHQRQRYGCSRPQPGLTVALCSPGSGMRSKLKAMPHRLVGTDTPVSRPAGGGEQQGARRRGHGWGAVSTGLGCMSMDAAHSIAPPAPPPPSLRLGLAAHLSAAGGPWLQIDTAGVWAGQPPSAAPAGTLQNWPACSTHGTADHAEIVRSKRSCSQAVLPGPLSMSHDSLMLC